MNIRGIQFGPNNYIELLPKELEVLWNYEPDLGDKDTKKWEYDIAFVERPLDRDEIDFLKGHVRAYSLFVIEGYQNEKGMGDLLAHRMGQVLKAEDLQEFLQKDLRDYYGGSYGEKFRPHGLTVSTNFHGDVSWNGFSETVFDGEFGQEMSQMAFYRYNIPIELHQALDIWLEYETTSNVELELHCDLFPRGSVDEIVEQWVYTEEDMKDIIQLEANRCGGQLFFSIWAKGKGRVYLRGLHDRFSRHDKGYFLPGGKRHVTRKREELFSYFDPRDRKPPLCVYFSGYKTQEGFEGYHMMCSFGTPMLLIAESRLEGGAFYLGSREYEEMIRDTIEECMEELGFTREQVVFSGLSMGTFGAMYYGTFLKPGYILLGKPLASLGSMAQAERIHRPGGFPTSLDVLWKVEESLEDEGIEGLNHRFWDRFDHTIWADTTFIVAYMYEDDYDVGGYQNLVRHLSDDRCTIIGKGLHGRHNDDTSGIVYWFVEMYHMVLEQNYGRLLK